MRYIDSDNLTLREDFLCFIPVVDTTGSSLAATILENLSKLGLDLNYLRGQGYDGAASIRGEFRGVQAHIRQRFPKAVYTLRIALLIL